MLDDKFNDAAAQENPTPKPIRETLEDLFVLFKKRKFLSVFFHYIEVIIFSFFFFYLGYLLIQFF